MAVGRLTTKSLAVAAETLAARHKELASIHSRHGPPPLWSRRPDFATLLQIILEQQVSLVSARTMFRKLRATIDPFAPERFLELGTPYLRSLGLTRQKAGYCVNVAEAWADGRLLSLSKMSDEEAHAALLDVKGIGPWTANIYLLMALRRPDIWPHGDIALATAVARLRNLKARPSFEELARIAEAWRPYRSVAARMLWQYYLAERDAANG